MQVARSSSVEMAGGSHLAFFKPFANHVMNPILRHVAGWLPFFALVTQVGRKSGIVRRNPVNILRRGDTYIVALTYGHDVNWLKNVIAAGGCEIRTGGRTIRLGPPEVIEDRQASVAPAWVRPVLRLLGMREYAVMQRIPSGSS